MPAIVAIPTCTHLAVAGSNAHLAPRSSKASGTRSSARGVVVYPGSLGNSTGARRPGLGHGSSGRAATVGGVSGVAALPEGFEALGQLAFFPFDNPIEKTFDSDGQLGPYFPIFSFVAYFLITSKVNEIRREQERKAMAKAATAVTEAATTKVKSISTEQWGKLVACLVIDALGDSSFLLPGLGEFSDGIFAPLEAYLLGALFQSNAVSAIGFAEEALPFTDVIPTATLAWLLETLCADWAIAKALGLGDKDPPPPTPKEE